jgi:hypothetical protein
VSVAARITHRTCTICNKNFQTQGHRKYCSGYCTKVAGRVLSKPQRLSTGELAPAYQLAHCQRCRMPFATQRANQTHCATCRKSMPESLPSASVLCAVTPAWDPLDDAEAAEATPVVQTLACVRCAHWVATPGAELGYSCQVSQYMRCKPYRPGSQPLTPRA